MEKKTDKIIKRKPKQKPKQKQKQRQKQSQNVIVNVTQPKSKSQSEERSFIPMMPSFNSPSPIQQQSPLNDLAKLIGFLTPQMKSGVSLGSSIPEVETSEPVAKKEIGGLYKIDTESLLGKSISNSIKATPKIEEPEIEEINMMDPEIEEASPLPIKKTRMSTTKISKIIKPVPPLEEAVIVQPIEEAVIVPQVKKTRMSTTKISKIIKPVPPIEEAVIVPPVPPIEETVIVPPVPPVVPKSKIIVVPKSKIIDDKPKKEYKPMEQPTIAELRRDYLERFGEIVPKRTQKNKIKNALIANQKLGKSIVI